MLLQMVKIVSFYGWIIFHCMYTSHPLYSFICEGHLGCLHILAILNNSAVSIGVYSFSTNVFLFFRCIRRSGIAGSCDSIFWGSSILLSTVAIPVYIPTNSTWGLPPIFSTALSCNTWGHRFFFFNAIRLKLKHQLFWVFSLQILRLVNFHNCISQIPYNKSVSLHLSYRFSLKILCLKDIPLLSYPPLRE